MENKLKIIFVSPEFLTGKVLHDGGLAAYLFKICKALNQIGHNAAVVMPGDNYKVIDYDGVTTIMTKTTDFKLEKILTEITFRRFNRFWQWIFQSYGLNKGVKDYIREKNEKVDILQFSSYKAVALFAPKNIPYVIRISSLQRIWESLEVKKPGFGKMIVYKLEEHVIRNCKNVYGPGKYLAGTIKSRLKPSSEIEILPTPLSESVPLLDNQIYASIEKKINNNGYILYFGTVSFLKGAKCLTEIINTVLSDHQQLSFVIIGKSNDCSIYGKVIDYVFHFLNEVVRQRVHYFPGMNRSKLIPFIQNAKAIVIPSIVDNFPNTALEAMQCGKVIFASDRASLNNLIKDGINGYLCEYNNSNDYRTKISTFLNKTEKEKQEMECSIKESIVDHNPINAAQKLVEYFMKVIGNERK